MKAFFKEPLVHFLLGGALIFLFFNLLDETPPTVSENRLEITDQDVDRLIARFEATWRRAPSDEELSHLVDQLVRQEVLVREALALGLDRGDEVVRQRLVQKMTFLAEGSIAALEPSDEELKAHMLAHQDRFQSPDTIAFKQVLLKDGVDPDVASSVLTADGDLEELVTPTLLPGRFPLTSRMVIDRTFGNGFFDALVQLEPGVWTGAVTSAYGSHAVFVEDYRPSFSPDLADVRDAVELDWRSLRERELTEERITSLLARYEIVLPDTLSVSAQ